MKAIDDVVVGPDLGCPHPLGANPAWAGRAVVCADCGPALRAGIAEGGKRERALQELIRVVAGTLRKIADDFENEDPRDSRCETRAYRIRGVVRAMTGGAP